MKSKKSTTGGGDSERMVEIFVKATDIFYEKGYEGTSMSDIASAMQLSKAGLYHHIESKEDLLFKIMNYGLDWLDKEVLEPARDLSDPEERLRWVIRRHGRQLLEGSRSMSILTDEVFALGAQKRRRILERQRAYFDLVRDAIAAMKEQGRVRSIDPTLAAFSLFGMLLWLPRWHRPDGELTTAQVLDQVIALYFKGLLGG